VSAFIDQERERFAVDLICRTLGVSPSAYYQRATGKRSARVVEDERLLERIRELHERNYFAYGSRRMWKALLRSGESVGRGRVERLMRTNQIQGAKRRGKPWRTTISDPLAHRRPDLVQRDFTAARPDQLWVADFTYVRFHGRIVFFSFVIDVFSRRVVGWQFATHMRTDLVLAGRSHGADVELVHHSDRGSQYTSIDFTQTLNDHGVLASVGSTGDAYDNAMAESFVDTFKTELIAERYWTSLEQLEFAIVEWVGWFNHDRLHENLADRPPAEVEALYAAHSLPTPSLR
jgi:putative transposase